MITWILKAVGDMTRLAEAISQADKVDIYQEQHRIAITAWKQNKIILNIIVETDNPQILNTFQEWLQLLKQHLKTQ